MQTVLVKYMFACPFAYEETYQISELTVGSDTMCTILKENCQQRYCPLKKEQQITVRWSVE